MVFTDLLPWQAWATVSRLGEAQLLLPAHWLAVLWWSRRQQAPALARTWLIGTALAALLTTVSKVAFLGFGLGWAWADFTGFSGHSMFAAALWPPLLALLLRPPAVAMPTAAWPTRGALAGAAVALVVGVSRVALQAHSWSEVLAGLALGGAVSVLTLRQARPQAPQPGWRLLPWAAAGVLALAVDAAPPSTTHDWVTRLALRTSGRSTPYQREHLQAPRRGPSAAEPTARPAAPPPLTTPARPPR